MTHYPVTNVVFTKIIRQSWGGGLKSSKIINLKYPSVQNYNKRLMERPELKGWGRWGGGGGLGGWRPLNKVLYGNTPPLPPSLPGCNYTCLTYWLSNVVQCGLLAGLHLVISLQINYLKKQFRHAFHVDSSHRYPISLKHTVLFTAPCYN